MLSISKYSQKALKKQAFLPVIKRKVGRGMTKKSYDRMEKCGSYLIMHADETHTKLRLANANFCGNRFCLFCQWRQSQKDAMKLSIMTRYAIEEKEKALIFLTLTAPNVKAENLKAEITRYNKAFKNLMRDPVVDAAAHGYVRRLEVTYNVERNDYHPHFHVLIAVDKQYFSGKEYIHHSRWLSMWRYYMKDDSIENVDVRRFKGSNDDGILEMAKYIAKSEDLFYSEQVFDAFWDALRRRQVLTFGGMFSELNTMYKAGELDYLKEIDTTEYVYEVTYQWNRDKRDYEEIECRPLTDGERFRLRKFLIDEVDLE